MNYLRILICYADTGGGHKTAAHAVRDAIEELAAENYPGSIIEVTVESVVEETNALNTLFVRLYNFLLRYHQDWMKYYTAFIEAFKPNDSRLGYLFCKPFLEKLYSRIEPDIIVSVHPMVNHYLALARKDAGRTARTNLVVVLTDPNSHLWSGWACKEADLTIAPNDLACARLKKMGVDPARIQTIGMPIEPVFVHPARVSRTKVLTDLGLDSRVFTILLSGGWAGGGELIELYRSLARVTRPAQVVIMCGNNKDLRAKMEEEKKGFPLPTAVIGYCQSFSDLFSAGDLLVTKAGGLTTFEAVARRLPMALNLLIEPMPQEAGTIDLLIEAGLAHAVRHKDDLIQIIENLHPLSDRQTQPLPTEHSLDRVDAIYEIAQTILDLRLESRKMAA